MSKSTFQTFVLVVSKKFLGEFEELVLLAIRKLGTQAYGVGIAEIIETVTEKKVSTGALYTTLSRLEEKGFISSRLGEPTGNPGGRAKRFFKLEIAGKQALLSSQETRRKLSADVEFA